MTTRDDVGRYVAIGSDATRSIVFMLGENGRNGVIPVNSGPSYSVRRDYRLLYGAWAIVLRSGVVVPGIQISIVTLTGNSGDTWLRELAQGIQGSGELVTLRQTPMPVQYGVGMLVTANALAAADVLQIGCVYD